MQRQTSWDQKFGDVLKQLNKLNVRYRELPLNLLANSIIPLELANYCLFKKPNKPTKLATGDQKRYITLEAKITRKLSEIDQLSKCAQHRWSEEGTLIMDQSYEKTARLTELKEQLAELYRMREDFELHSHYWPKTISVEDDVMVREMEASV